MSKIKYIGFDMDYTIAGMCTYIISYHFSRLDNLVTAAVSVTLPDGEDILGIRG